MTSVLKPEITSITNGLVAISVRSVSEVEAIFDQLLVFRADSANGPFTNISIIVLDGSGSYSLLDLTASPARYYKAQYRNSSTLISSVFSELAQETGVFSEYTVPTSTATYPPEIALSEQDREIVESIRITVGDMGSVERDFYDSSEASCQVSCGAQISSNGCTWELSEPRGWPLRVILDGVDKTTLTDPQVLGYKFLAFSGTGPCITGTLDIFYNHFRFSDREILMAYDRSINLIVSCGLEENQITTEMRIMQAAILLLEGEARYTYEGSVRIRDGDTSYDNTGAIAARNADLEDLRRKMRELLECARINASYDLEGVRVD
jgi:hypothetical protein